jgi:hypothetical protein
MTRAEKPSGETRKGPTRNRFTDAVNPQGREGNPRGPQAIGIIAGLGRQLAESQYLHAVSVLGGGPTEDTAARDRVLGIKAVLGELGDSRLIEVAQTAAREAQTEHALQGRGRTIPASGPEWEAGQY